MSSEKLHSAYNKITLILKFYCVSAEYQIPQKVKEWFEEMFLVAKHKWINIFALFCIFIYLFFIQNCSRTWRDDALKIKTEWNKENMMFFWKFSTFLVSLIPPPPLQHFSIAETKFHTCAALFLLSDTVKNLLKSFRKSRKGYT